MAKNDNKLMHTVVSLRYMPCVNHACTEYVDGADMLKMTSA